MPEGACTPSYCNGNCPSNAGCTSHRAATSYYNPGTWTADGANVRYAYYDANPAGEEADAGNTVHDQHLYDLRDAIDNERRRRNNYVDNPYPWNATTWDGYSSSFTNDHVRTQTAGGALDTNIGKAILEQLKTALNNTKASSFTYTITGSIVDNIWIDRFRNAIDTVKAECLCNGHCSYASCGCHGDCSCNY